MIQSLKIPSLRVSALVGKGGKTKKKLQSTTCTVITISREGVVELSGEPEQVLTAAEIVKAIGRGFSQKKAFMLLSENNSFTSISLEGETEKTRKRLLSRVIGMEGKAKERIEKLTGAQLCIFGKTVSIIGSCNGVDQAAIAVENLLAGRKHAYVYAKLNKMKRLNP